MHKPYVLGALASAFLLASCSSGDEPTVSAADRASGAEFHPQLLAEFGGAYDGDERHYLMRMGEQIARQANLDGQCTFTLVNSDVVNAFAVPGCYIYITRGLMALVNSEAELAAVLSHELGHIVARHSQRQQRRSLWRSLGVVAVQFVTGSERLTQLAGATAGLFTLRYSRTQEYEADDLGLRFLRQAGYDPFASVDMLEALARQENFMLQTRGRDEARSIPEWARTHPLTSNRMERARDAAAGLGIARGSLPEKELEYVTEVDGLLYGDDPAQGFVTGRSFAHPVMRIAFEAPEGFTLTNSPQAILIEGPDGMRGEFAGGRLPAGGLDAYTSAMLKQLFGEARLELREVRRSRVNGVPALFTRGSLQSGSDSVIVTIGAYAAGSAAYHFVLISKPAATPSLAEQMLQSFRLISDKEAANLRPRKIEGTVASGRDTILSLAARMAGENKIDHFLMLNGRQANQPIRPGEPVKLVIYASP